MILGLGIDIVNVTRLRAWEDKPELLSRFFHSREIKEAREKSGTLSLAARFAAKESFGKALGTGIRGFTLKEMRVESDELGKPCMILSGKAEAAFKQFGGKRLHVSLTHERDNAVAVVVIEGDSP